MGMQPKILPRWFAVLTALFILGLVYPSAGLFVCLGVAVYALRGPVETIQALSILAFLIMTSIMDISLGRWAILFAAFGRTMWDGLFGKLSAPRVLYPVLIFICVVFATSLLNGVFPVVSVLKLVTFAIGTISILTAFYQTRHLMPYWLSWLCTLGLFILVASLPFYVLPAGYARNGVGFQGITSHPQTFGPILAPLTALFTGLYLFSRGKQPWWVGFAALLGWLGMYASLSRTSIFAAMLALGIATAIGYLVRSATWGRVLTQALGRPTVIIAGLFIFGFAVAQSSAIQNQFSEFISKDQNVTSVSGMVMESRGGLISSSMANFRDNPVIGIGFGAPSNPERFARQLETGPMGIPVSASVEKGFMPSAVLEETGIIGAILILVVLGYLFAPAIRQGDIIAFWILATAVLINFGEMIFFTMGGNGLYLWIMMGFCYCWSLQGLPPSNPFPRRPPPQRRNAGRPDASPRPQKVHT